MDATSPPTQPHRLLGQAAEGLDSTGACSATRAKEVGRRGQRHCCWWLPGLTLCTPCRLNQVYPSFSALLCSLCRQEGDAQQGRDVCATVLYLHTCWAVRVTTLRFPSAASELSASPRKPNVCNLCKAKRRQVWCDRHIIRCDATQLLGHVAGRSGAGHAHPGLQSWRACSCDT